MVGRPWSAVDWIYWIGYYFVLNFLTTLLVIEKILSGKTDFDEIRKAVFWGVMGAILWPIGIVFLVKKFRDIQKLAEAKKLNNE